VAPAFDRSPEFAIDKPACFACPNLDGADRCRIHDRLEPEGFRGCVLYDCLGAGQRVMQELYPGRSWRDEPELLEEMWRALTALRGVHELILLLTEAAKLPLSPDERATLEALLEEFDPAGATVSDHLAACRAPLIARAADFLRSLRRHVAR